MVNEVTLNFLGTSFNITTDADEAYLEKVLNQFHCAIDKTQNISGINDPLNVAVLTGFMLCDEINRLKQKLESAQNDTAEVSNINKEVKERTWRLIARLDQEIINEFD